MIERNLVAEEEGFVGGHRLDHLRRQRLCRSSLHLLDQFGDSRQPDPSCQGNQSAFDQVLLVGRQIQSGALFQELAQEFIVWLCHDRSPANNRTNFGAMSPSGRTAAQMPVLAATPSIPQTTLEASS